MSFLLIAAGAVVVTGSQPSGQLEPVTDYVDVAYEELRDHQNQAAIERIGANQSLQSEDPARLINLGTAHARMGRRQQAASLYLAAIASRTPYELELSDGRWVDSRRAARMALSGLETGTLVAVR